MSNPRVRALFSTAEASDPPAAAPISAGLNAAKVARSAPRKTYVTGASRRYRYISIRETSFQEILKFDLKRPVQRIPVSSISNFRRREVAMAIRQPKPMSIAANSQRRIRPEMSLYTVGVNEASKAVAMKNERNPIIAAGANLSGRPSKTSAWGRAILAPFGVRKHEVVLRAPNRGHWHRRPRRLPR